MELRNVMNDGAGASVLPDIARIAVEGMIARMMTTRIAGEARQPRTRVTALCPALRCAGLKFCLSCFPAGPFHARNQRIQ